MIVLYCWFTRDYLNVWISSFCLRKGLSCFFIHTRTNQKSTCKSINPPMVSLIHLLPPFPVLLPTDKALIYHLGQQSSNVITAKD